MTTFVDDGHLFIMILAGLTLLSANEVFIKLVLKDFEFVDDFQFLCIGSLVGDCEFHSVDWAGHLYLFLFAWQRKRRQKSLLRNSREVSD